VLTAQLLKVSKCVSICCFVVSFSLVGTSSAEENMALGKPMMPKMADNHNEVVYTKSSARFRNIMMTHGLPKGAPEAKRLPHSKVLPSPFNRLGNPLNMMYIHHELTHNIGKDGFRVSRPTPGLVVRRSGDKLTRLHEASKKLIKQHSKLLPPIALDESANRECLGGNHLTVALRMYASSYTSPLSGHKCVIKNDPDLEMTCAEGHFYFELDESVSDEDCRFLSELLNSDQNQNQCHSEDHLRLQIKEVLSVIITPDKPSVPTSTIISKVCELSVVKLRPEHVGDTAQYVSAFHGSPYIEQLSRWYSQNVNPRQLSISARWMADVARIWGKTRGLCKLGATMLHYRGLVVIPGTAPNPDTSRTVDVPLLTSVAQNAANLDECEDILRKTRETYQKMTVMKLGPDLGVDCFLAFEEISIRLLLGKSLTMDGITHGVSGKWSVDKQMELRNAWLKSLATTHSELKDLAYDLHADVPVGGEEVFGHGHLKLISMDVHI